jgi:site-specific recombinase XerD
MREIRHGTQAVQGCTRGAPRNKEAPWRRAQAEQRVSVTGDVTEPEIERLQSRFLFLSERKPPLSIDGAQKLIERLGEAARLPFPIHAHMLRHSAGYALAGRGVDTRTLQAFMGHRSIANTVIYTAVADKRLRHIWDR